MKVTADHWVNVDGHWYRSGETYDDGKPEAANTEQPEANKVEAEPEQPKRTRKRTTAK